MKHFSNAQLANILEAAHITSENLDSTIEDMLASESFMKCIYSGFDGLCGDCYDTLSCEIEQFYTALENK